MQISRKVLSRKNVLISVATVLCAAILATVSTNLFVKSYQKYILDIQAAADKDIRVGIVFGAGIAPNGRPYDELSGRLDGAAELYEKGVIEKILVSGDNRFVNYNEPQAMLTYLVVDKNIPAEAIQQDYAGRSTYETCDRAHRVFGLDEAILITSSSHLPRALFTCRKLGVETFGVAYGEDANNASRRELMARVKAALNIYIRGEDTILGEPISL